MQPDWVWTVGRGPFRQPVGRDRFILLAGGGAGHKARGRLRLRQELSLTVTPHAVTNEVRYVHDGRLVVQERHFNPQLSTIYPQRTVTYTRGLDLSGSLEGAGGIGGLLDRTDSIASGPLATAYYHAAGNGNVTLLIDAAQKVAARYDYDPFGNTLAMSGPLASANGYRFSSKEVNPATGLYAFGKRFYHPHLQRWLNRDPLGIAGGINLYAYVGNQGCCAIDPWGLRGINIDAKEVPGKDAWTDPYSPWNTDNGPQTLGVTTYKINTPTTAFAVWNAQSQICSIRIRDYFAATIRARWLGIGVYVFSKSVPKSFLTYTDEHGSFLHTGYVVNLTGDLRAHEMAHARIYQRYLTQTHVWREEAISEFNNLQTRVISQKSCQGFLDRINAEFDDRIIREGAAAARAHDSLDSFVAEFLIAGPGLLQYVRTRGFSPQHIESIPGFEWDRGAGIVRLRSDRLIKPFH